MTSCKKSDVYSRALGLVCLDQPGGQLVLMPNGVSDHFFVVDHLAAECVRLIDGSRTVSEIIFDVCNSHEGLSQEMVTGDFTSLLDDLLEAGLIYIDG